MRKLLFVIGTFIFISCGSSQDITKAKKGTSAAKETEDLSLRYASTITAEDLKTHLYIYASDEFEGRLTGSKGQKKAVEYLKNF